MENRSLSVVAGLIALLAIATASADEDLAASWQTRLDRAAELQARGKAMNGEAKQRFSERSALCAEKFMVNACREEARQDYLQASRAADRLDYEGKNLERQVKREQLAERERQRESEAPQRAAELQERAEETAAARQAAADQAAAKQAGKAQQALVGEQRKAAAEEKQRQKEAAHAAKVATQKARAEQRAAEAAAKP